MFFCSFLQIPAFFLNTACRSKQRRFLLSIIYPLSLWTTDCDWGASNWKRKACLVSWPHLLYFSTPPFLQVIWIITCSNRSQKERKRKESFFLHADNNWTDWLWLMAYVKWYFYYHNFYSGHPTETKWKRAKVGGDSSLVRNEGDQ